MNIHVDAVSKSGSARSHAYRPDIDGLRALAVMLVTVFHINEALVPGGFIGVDMFFVISGYLITGIIVRDCGAGTFSFAEFYRRRIRRIFPAMFAVTFATLVIGTLLLLPEDLEHLAWSALATIASGANIFFTYFLDTSYFAADSATIPLLHMWSLGVEEQFYFVWPLLLLILLKGARRWLFAALAALIVGSVAIGEWQLRTEQFEWAYYMLPSRIFQLAIGGALVFLPLPNRFLAWILAPIGLSLVLISAFVLSGSSLFPGLAAVPVTIGTAALLASGGHATPVSAMFSLKPLRLVGLISYSLYLWHWPVLAFQRYFYGELNPLQQVVSFAVMLGLAVVSYLMIEKPFRTSDISFGRAMVWLGGVPSVAVAAIAAGLILTSGYGPFQYTSYPDRLAAISEIKSAPSFSYVCQRPLLRSSDIKSDICILGEGDPRVLLYGDSHASHYVGIVGELAREARIPLRIYAHSACVPLDSDPTPFVNPQRLSNCIASHEAVSEDLGNYDLIFLGASWDSYVRAGARNGADLTVSLEAFVSSLAVGGTQVVLLDTVPRQQEFDARCGRKMLKLAVIDCSAVGVSDSQSRFSGELHAIAERVPRVSVLSVRRQMCQSGRCPAFDTDGTALYFDTGHLSAEGTWRIGQRLMQSDDSTSLIEMMRSYSKIAPPR